MTTTATPPTVPSYVNWIVKRLLRSPFHRIMSRNTMELTFTGRKSGKQYTAVVRYVRSENAITCYTDSKWWINLQGGAPVEMLIGRRVVFGTATVIKDPESVAESLAGFLAATPGDSKYYGVRRTPEGLPQRDDIHAAAQYTTVVRIVPADRVV
ncbi:hypothetical protein [Nocardia jejuensis]|uniref:hypothetical protein n=1 Tax=Nocardia jejuensis TaxID=328049 RepID=UPI00082F312B|nr:hypothetical protein [Nocardia jejuensis]